MKLLYSITSVTVFCLRTRKCGSVFFGVEIGLEPVVGNIDHPAAFYPDILLDYSSSCALADFKN